MDGRTQQLIDALQHPGAAAILHLLTEGPKTQDELRQAIADTSQATLSRRLEELGKLGLLNRDPGPRQYKDRPWFVTVPEGTDSLLGAAIALSEAIAQLEKDRRVAVESRLRDARRRRGTLDSLPTLSAEESGE